MPFDDDFRRWLSNDAFLMMPLWRCLCNNAIATITYHHFSWNRSSFFHNVKECQHYWHLKWKQRDFEYLQKAVSLLTHEMHMSPIMLVSNCAHGSNRDGTPFQTFEPSTFKQIPSNHHQILKRPPSHQSLPRGIQNLDRSKRNSFCWFSI